MKAIYLNTHFIDEKFKASRSKYIPRARVKMTMLTGQMVEAKQ